MFIEAKDDRTGSNSCGVSHAKLQSNCYHQQNNTQWGTGTRGLMRGMAPLPK